MVLKSSTRSEAFSSIERHPAEFTWTRPRSRSASAVISQMRRRKHFIQCRSALLQLYMLLLSLGWASTVHPRGCQGPEIMGTGNWVPTAASLHGDWSIGRSPGKNFRIGQSPCRLAAVYYFRALAFLRLILASLVQTDFETMYPQQLNRFSSFSVLYYYFDLPSFSPVSQLSSYFISQAIIS